MHLEYLAKHELDHLVEKSWNGWTAVIQTRRTREANFGKLLGWQERKLGHFEAGQIVSGWSHYVVEQKNLLLQVLYVKAVLSHDPSVRN